MKLGWLHDRKNDAKWDACRDAKARGLTVGVNWYLTDAPASPVKGANLGDRLAENYRDALRRACQLLSDEGIVDVHFVEPIPRKPARQQWLDHGRAQLAGCGFVLLDPDTGIHLGSGSPDSAHVAAVEVALFAAFAEVAVFQHFARQGVGKQQALITERLRAAGVTGPIWFTPMVEQYYLVMIGR
jgi:hypothetical protein